MNSLNSDSPYISQSDEAQYERLKKFNSTEGIGEVVYLDDEDINNYNLQDFGLTGIDK